MQDTTPPLPTRLLQILLGTIWGGALLWAGLYVWHLWPNIATWGAEAFRATPQQAGEMARLAAIGIGAAGLVIFECLVADEICPRTPPWFRQGMPLLTIVVASASLTWVVAAVCIHWP